MPANVRHGCGSTQLLRTSLDHIPDRVVCGLGVQQLIDAAEQHGGDIGPTVVRAYGVKERRMDVTLRSGYVYQIYAYLRSQVGRGDPLADSASVRLCQDGRSV